MDFLTDDDVGLTPPGAEPQFLSDDQVGISQPEQPEAPGIETLGLVEPDRSVEPWRTLGPTSEPYYGTYAGVPPEQRQEEFGEALTRPAIPFPRLPSVDESPAGPLERMASAPLLSFIIGDQPAAQVNRSLINMAVSLPEFFTTPLGILTAGAGAAGRVAKTAVAGGFTFDLLKSALGQSKELVENWPRMTPAARTGAVVDILGTTAMGGTAGVHTARSIRNLLPRTSIEAARDIESEVSDAIEARIQQESRLGEYPGIEAQRATAEAGGGYRVEPSAEVGRGQTVAQKAPLLLDEEAAYIEAERGAIDLPVEVVEVLHDETTPFARASNRVATIRPDGTIEIAAPAYRRWLADIPKENQTAAVQALLAEESNHARVQASLNPGERAQFWDSMTAAEKAAFLRIYTGEWSVEAARARHGIDLSPEQLGYEAMNHFQMRLAKMTPRETVEAVGREKWTVQSLEIFAQALYRARRALGTEASGIQAALLDKVINNVSIAKAAAAASTPGALAKYQPDEVAERIERLRAASHQDFDAQTRAASGGLTEDAWRVGLSLTAEAQLETLADARIESSNRMRQALREGRTQEALGYGFRAQYWREAYEAATGTGSAGFAFKKEAGYEPPFKRAEAETPAALRKGKAEEKTAELFLPDVPKGTAVERGAEFGYQPVSIAAMEGAVAKHLSESATPSFNEFVKEARLAFGEQLKPGQLRDAWSDAVWKNLMQASGSDLSRTARQLGLSKRLKLETPTGESLEIADAPPAERAQPTTLLPGIEQPAYAPRSRALSTRYRVIAAIGEKLITDAEGGRRYLNRKEVTAQDIADPKIETKQPVYQEFTTADQGDPATLGQMLTSDARAFGGEAATRVIGGQKVRVQKKGFPVSATKRLTTIQNKATGKVYQVSTYRDGRRGAVLLDPAAPGTTHVPLARILPRYRVIDSVLLDEPVQNFKQTYSSLSEYERMAGEDFREAARTGLGYEPPPTVEGVPPETVSAQGPITPEESRSIIDQIIEEVGDPKEAQDIKLAWEAAGQHPNARNISFGMRKLGRELLRKEPNLNEQQFLDKLSQQIYEDYHQAETFEDFQRRALEQSSPPNRAPVRMEAEPIAPTPPAGRLESAPRELTMRERIPPTVTPGQVLPKGPGPEPTLPPPVEPATLALGERAYVEEGARRMGEAPRYGSTLYRQLAQREVPKERYRIGQRKPLAEYFEKQWAEDFEKRRAEIEAIEETEAGQAEGQAPAALQKGKRPPIPASLGIPLWEAYLSRLGEGEKELFTKRPSDAELSSLVQDLAMQNARDWPLPAGLQDQLLAWFDKQQGTFWDRRSIIWQRISDLVENQKEAMLGAPDQTSGAGMLGGYLGQLASEITRLRNLLHEIAVSRQLPKDQYQPAALIKPAAKAAVKGVEQFIGDPIRAYSEWMTDKLKRVGGPKAQAMVDAVEGMISRQKALYGGLTPTLDPARRMAGRPSRATYWMHQLRKVTESAAYSNTQRAIEGRIGVPQFARELVRLAQQANLDIGSLLLKQATGKFQRNLTAFGYDILSQGSGPVWDAWIEGNAKANGKTIPETEAFFKSMKAILDDPNVDTARIEKVNQDFARVMPNAITHVKHAGMWHPVIHADLFNYLENAAQRAAHVAAFREWFPNNKAGRAAFGALMEDVRSELPGKYYQNNLTALMKALQGHPTDSYSDIPWMRPGTAPGEAIRFVNQTLGNLFARLVLTGQMFVQPGENIVGATPSFLGYRNYLRGMARLITSRDFYTQLEQTGAVNRVILDYSFDPTSPVRSAFRITGNVISKAFMEQLLNEIQEASAAATAAVVGERIRATTTRQMRTGTVTTSILSDWERAMLPETFRAMGFNKAEVAEMMQGNPELLDRFERRAASFLTAGNKAIAEGSRLGANRMANSIFRFQTYPMMKVNQFRQVFGRFWDVWSKASTGTEKAAATYQLSRFLASGVAQGALTAGLTALAYQGLSGGKIKAAEAADEPLEFGIESMLATMSGPLYMLWQGARDKGLSGATDKLTSYIFPFAIASEIWNFSFGKGPYRDQNLWDRIGKFTQRKVPGTRAIAQGMAMSGLSTKNAELDAAISGFYRWRADNLGATEYNVWLKEDDRKAFRTAMRRALEAMKRGEDENYDKAIEEAYEAADTPKQVGSSMRARQILKTPDGKDLDIDQLEALRRNIGNRAVDLLEEWDAMIEAEAYRLTPRRAR